MISKGLYWILRNNARFQQDRSSPYSYIWYKKKTLFCCITYSLAQKTSPFECESICQELVQCIPWSNNNLGRRSPSSLVHSALGDHLANLRIPSSTNGCTSSFTSLCTMELEVSNSALTTFALQIVKEVRKRLFLCKFDSKEKIVGQLN